MNMQTADVVAVYGAALSTALALSQGVGAWRGRTKLAVAVEFFHSADAALYGTPVQVRRGDDARDESVAVQLTIRNLGGVPVQALGLVIESTDFDAGTRLTYQITPGGFPVVLDPGTTVEGILQKEHFDMLEECTFLGIVDGMARRHSIPRKQAARFLTECWRLPTRVNVFQRRDDPANQVAAFQAAEPARLTTRRVSGLRKRRPSSAIAKRPKPLIRTLLDGDQARVRLASEDPR
jgi:hypothetical protein